LSSPIAKEPAMPIRRLTLLAQVTVLAAALAPSASAQAPAPPQSLESAQAQAQTVRDMRNVGTALFAWLTDEVVDDNKSLAADPENDKTCVSWKHETSAGVETDVCASLEIDRLPIISHQELTRILVPQYIMAIPEKDGWGHPFEFRLDRKHLLNKSVMAIRSAGSDGKFSGTHYETGGFTPADAGQDLVWMDGFFIRWPEKKPAPEPR